MHPIRPRDGYSFWAKHVARRTTRFSRRPPPCRLLGLLSLLGRRPLLSYRSATAVPLRLFVALLLSRGRDGHELTGFEVAALVERNVEARDIVGQRAQPPDRASHRSWRTDIGGQSVDQPRDLDLDILARVRLAHEDIAALRGRPRAVPSPIKTDMKSVLPEPQPLAIIAHPVSSLPLIPHYTQG